MIRMTVDEAIKHYEHLWKLQGQRFTEIEILEIEQGKERSSIFVEQSRLGKIGAGLRMLQEGAPNTIIEFP